MQPTNLTLLIILILALLPTITTSAAAICFYSTLTRKRKASSLMIGCGLVALLITFTQLFLWSATGEELGRISVWFMAGAASIAALLSGICFCLGYNNSWKFKLAFIAFGMPAAFFLVTWIGNQFTPSVLHKKDGIAIVRALEQYKVETGYYPQNLNVLVPEYLRDLRTPKDDYGWLYRLTDRGFALGFVASQKKSIITSCFLQSSDQIWKCREIHWDGFPDWGR